MHFLQAYASNSSTSTSSSIFDSPIKDTKEVQSKNLNKAAVTNNFAKSYGTIPCCSKSVQSVSASNESHPENTEHRLSQGENISFSPPQPPNGDQENFDARTFDEDGNQIVTDEANDKDGDSALTKKQHVRNRILNECKCVMECRNKVGLDERRILNAEYWKAKPDARKRIIREHVKREQVKRRRVDPNSEYRKIYSYTYQLQDAQQVVHNVCRTFFLNTIGFEQSSSNTITRAFGIDDENFFDKRGKHARDRSLSDDMIKNIKMYDPQPSHYHRENCPKALYLASDIGRKDMFEGWKASRELEGKEVGSASLYNKCLKELNIRFVKKGGE